MKPRIKIIRLIKIGESMAFDCSQPIFQTAVIQSKTDGEHRKFSTKKFILVDPAKPENSKEITVATRVE